jgi:tetratricopeptide (TPR) repeat protein
MLLYVMLLIIGIAYILIWGGMSLLRREGLSMRFALEALAITLIFTLLAAIGVLQIHPVLFLALLYLITLRARLLVDLANSFAKRGQFLRADRIYNFASRLWPDNSSSMIINLNHTISLLQRGETDRAIEDFNGLLRSGQGGYLGVKYEAAAHYNLAQAYLRKGMGADATREFNLAIDTWPGSEYSRRAQHALERQRHKASTSVDDKTANP